MIFAAFSKVLSQKKRANPPYIITLYFCYLKVKVLL